MKKRKIALLLMLIIITGYLLYFLATNHVEIKDITKFVKSAGAWTPILFVIIYSLLPVFLMPITPLSIASGVLFGPIIGTIYTVMGQITSATIAFFASRYILKDEIDKRSHEKVAIFQEKITKYGWEFVLASRLTPIFPFTLQNHLFGVTNISYKTYILASFLPLAAGSFVFTYAGYAGKSILSGDKSSITAVCIAIAGFLALSFIPRFFIKKDK